MTQIRRKWNKSRRNGGQGYEGAKSISDRAIHSPVIDILDHGRPMEGLQGTGEGRECGGGGARRRRKGDMILTHYTVMKAMTHLSRIDLHEYNVRVRQREGLSYEIGGLFIFICSNTSSSGA